MDSAVVIRIDLPPALDRLRRRYVRNAALGVPGHVTLLHPFLSTERLDPSVRAALAEIAAAEAPFECSFSTVERWPEVVYLAPRPAQPFVRLAAALERRFPELPPYGGAHGLGFRFVPHVTIARLGAEGSGVGRAADGFLAAAGIVERAVFRPFVTHIGRMTVIAEGHDGRWRRHWSIGFGGPSPSL